jgi:hypothetical protein
MRVGIAYFDDPKFLEQQDTQLSGWYSVDGEVPGRFYRPTDLASDVIWITNTEYAEFTNNDIAEKGANLRNLGYLNTNLSAITEDLGISPDVVRLDETVQKLSLVVGRILRLMREVYSTDAMFSGYQVSRGLRQVLMPKGVERISSPGLMRALSDSFQNYSRCVVRSKSYGSRNKYFSVRKNRLAHVRELMETQFPAGRVELITSSQMPTSNRLQWLYSLGRPFVAKVSLTNVDPDVSDILAFGQRKAKGERASREWVSSLEAILLDAYATVSIESAWIWDELVSIPARYQLPESLLKDEWFELSYSAQMAAELHYSALVQMPRLPAALGGGIEVTPMAIWLKSMDRLLSFEMAKVIAEEGLVPFGYSSGSVSVRVTHSDEYQRINNLVRDTGWSFPLPIKEPEGEEDVA